MGGVSVDRRAWFVVRFKPGSPLGVESIAFGPFPSYLAGFVAMRDWRRAPEVLRVESRISDPGLPDDRTYGGGGIKRR